MRRAFVKSALTVCLAVLSHMSGSGSAQAQVAAKEVFGNTPLPALTEPQVHGFYSKGCIGGAVAMPTDGPNWQAMRLERNRRWGHPDLIALVQQFAGDAAKDGWPGLLVGDISQPRGGPMLTGHASHQVGLDADIWLTKMPDRRLTPDERRDTSAISVLKQGELTVDPAIWTPQHAKLLARAASYNSVERLFVHPGIKKAMCETYGDQPANNPWMIKIRPAYGHHYHFHIRMKCPANSPNCRKQDPVPASGNGCDASLDWWFTSEPWTPKKPTGDTKPVKKRVVTVADLPKECTAVLNALQPTDESLVTLNANFDPVRAMASGVPSEIPAGALGGTTVPVAELPVPGVRPSR
ncbi:MAG: penicillin-insensitive murein endopeptidase [Ahrensia sp.]